MTVKVHGADSLGQPFSQTASVMDVSESGVRLEGVHVLYRAGQTAVLEYNGNKAQYRVVWVGGGALVGQAGLMNLEPEKPIFNLRFLPSGPDTYLVPPPERQGFDGGIRQPSHNGARRRTGRRNAAATRAMAAVAMRKSTSRARSSPSAAS
jgi:hypothetical protein